MKAQIVGNTVILHRYLNYRSFSQLGLEDCGYADSDWEFRWYWRFMPFV